MTSGARTIGSLSWQQNWLLGQIWSGIKRELETSSELPVALSRTLSVLSIRDIKRRCLNPTWVWTTLTVVRVPGFRPRCIVLTFARQVIELQDVGGGPRVTEKKSLKDLRSLSKDILGLTGLVSVWLPGFVCHTGRVSYEASKTKHWGSFQTNVSQECFKWLPLASGNHFVFWFNIIFGVVTTFSSIFNMSSFFCKLKM